MALFHKTSLILLIPILIPQFFAEEWKSKSTENEKVEDIQNFLERFFKIKNQETNVDRDGNDFNFDYGDDVYVDEVDNLPNDALSLYHRDLNRKHIKMVNHICEVRNNVVLFDEEGYKFTPRYITNVTCHASTDDKLRHHIVNTEFCVIRAPEYVNPCITRTKQTSIFKKERNSRTCWEEGTTVVAVGCGCEVGYKYLN